MAVCFFIFPLGSLIWGIEAVTFLKGADGEKGTTRNQSQPSNMNKISCSVRAGDRSHSTTALN